MSFLISPCDVSRPGTSEICTNLPQYALIISCSFIFSISTPSRFLYCASISICQTFRPSLALPDVSPPVNAEKSAPGSFGGYLRRIILGTDCSSASSSPPSPFSMAIRLFSDSIAIVLSIIRVSSSESVFGPMSLLRKYIANGLSVLKAGMSLT